MTDNGIAEIGNARLAWWSAGPDGDGEGLRSSSCTLVSRTRACGSRCYPR